MYNIVFGSNLRGLTLTEWVEMIHLVYLCCKFWAVIKSINKFSVELSGSFLWFFFHDLFWVRILRDFRLCCVECVCLIQCAGSQMFLLVRVVLVVTGRTPLVRRRVWRSQCRAMACQRWVGRLGGGGWLGGAGLAEQGSPPDASSPLSCCVVKQQAQ